MRLKDIDGWPPQLTESYTSRKGLPPSAPATLKRCRIYYIAETSSPYLSVVVEYLGRDWHAMITDHPESLLKRIEATLQGQEGRPLADLGDLEVVVLT
ncbi:MAG TPA: hypothetical protein VK661_05030 [Planctomycetota bacterium]|jgi:hypothetical protein|nr:hypothetical protein [Planctomycetota bacterium]